MGDPVINLRDYNKNKLKTESALKLVEDSTNNSIIANPENRSLKITLTISFILFTILIVMAASIFGKDNYYTLKKGENAYTVSGKFNVPLDILLKLNELTNPLSMKEGLRIKIPTVHDIHTVSDGDTLYSIAKQYGIKRIELVQYNRINGPKTLKPGDRIFIPAVLSDIHISVSERTGLVPFTVRFDIDTNTRDRVRSYRWNLGNDQISNNRNPTFTYRQKGTFHVSLTVVDENGSEVESNTIPIIARSLAHIGFNARKYVITNKDEIFSLDTKVIDNLNNTIDFNYKTEITQNPKLIRQIGTTDKFEIINTGYSKITIEAMGYSHTGYFFVSPIPSKHVEEPDSEWYKTQYGTGLNGNCGPACIAMCIHWANETNIGVRSVREQVGLPSEDGAIGFNHMINMFRKYKVNVKSQVIRSPAELRYLIDKNQIAILLINSGRIKAASGGSIQKNLFDRYYTDSVGHYIVIKGYSLDHKYFVVYDSIPGDWVSNRIRYADGVSMIGKNRYYSSDDIINAIKTRSILVISKE